MGGPPRITHRSSAWLIAMVLALTAAVLWPVVMGQFLNWDDPVLILENPLARSLDGATIKGMFFGVVEGNYQPLTFLSYAIEHALVGTDPLLYHIDNLLLHLVNVLLVYLLGVAVLGNPVVAALTAAAFGVHPAHVETVAWITERRNLLASTFSLSALLVYVGWARAGGRRDLKYAGIFLLLLLAALSKQVSMMIPLSFLVLDRLLGRPIGIPALREKIPFFVVAAGALLVNLWAQRTVGAVTTEALGWGARYALVPLHNIWFYVVKTLLPMGLSAFYAYPAPGELLAPWYLAGALAGAALLAAPLLPALRRSPAAAAFWFFAITILPVLRVIPAGNTTAADRYLYLPSLGLLLAMAYAGIALWRALVPLKGARTAMAVLVSAWLIFLCVQSHDRTLVWRDSVSLWSDVVAHDERNFLALYNLGTATLDAGDPGTAETHLTRALALKPHLVLDGQRVPDPYLHLGRGLARVELGKYDQATEDFLAALEAYPNWPPALDGLLKATKRP